MANYCNYSMCVRGAKKNIEEFIKVMQAKYDYEKNEFTHDRHMFNIHEATATEIEDTGNGFVYQAFIGGFCEMSVDACMFDDIMTYYGQTKHLYPDTFKGTTLLEESKRLMLDIEVFAEEYEFDNYEHYVIVNGTMVIEKRQKYAMPDWNFRLTYDV